VLYLKKIVFSIYDQNEQRWVYASCYNGVGSIGAKLWRDIPIKSKTVQAYLIRDNTGSRYRWSIRQVEISEYQRRRERLQHLRQIALGTSKPC